MLRSSLATRKPGLPSELQMPMHVGPMFCAAFQLVMCCNSCGTQPLKGFVSLWVSVVRVRC